MKKLFILFILTFANVYFITAYAECNLAMVDLDENAEYDNMRWQEGEWWYFVSPESREENGNPDDLGYEEWAVNFSYGTVYGESKCSAQIGNNYDWNWDDGVEINESDFALSEDVLDFGCVGEYCFKENCWCRATKYISKDDSICELEHSLRWFFATADFEAFGDCSDACAYFCAETFATNKNFRKVVFGSYIP